MFLKASREIIEARLTARSGHFFKPEMLASQFAALEEPGPEEPDVTTVNAERSLEEVVAAVKDLLGKCS